MSDEKDRPLTEGHQGSNSRGWNPKGPETTQPGPGESKGFQGQQNDEGGAPPPISQIPAAEEGD